MLGARAGERGNSANYEEEIRARVHDGDFASVAVDVVRAGPEGNTPELASRFVWSFSFSPTLLTELRTCTRYSWPVCRQAGPGQRSKWTARAGQKHLSGYPVPRPTRT